jgi:hypothetical protein
MNQLKPIQRQTNLIIQKTIAQLMPLQHESGTGHNNYFCMSNSNHTNNQAKKALSTNEVHKLKRRTKTHKD